MNSIFLKHSGHGCAFEYRVVVKMTGSGVLESCKLIAVWLVTKLFAP